MDHRAEFVRGAAARWGYVDWDDLDFRLQLNLTEQAMYEPMLHGSHTSVDELLDLMEKTLIEAFPDEDTFGTDAISQRELARAEARFGEAPRRTPKVDPEPSSITPDAPPTD